MAKPTTRADRVQELYPWLLHWSVADDRIGGSVTHAYAVRVDDGWLWIDALPLADAVRGHVEPVRGLFMTHGNHQRSNWRLRRERGPRSTPRPACRASTKSRTCGSARTPSYPADCGPWKRKTSRPRAT